MMFFALASLSVITSATGYVVLENNQNNVYQPSIIELVNSMNSTWKAQANLRFFGATDKDIAILCGTFVDGGNEKVYRLPLKTHSEEVMSKPIPEEFDSRKEWPKCAALIGHARDQASCGSCWAFGSTEAMNDRLCIASKGKFTQKLSVQHTTSCCGFLSCFSFGCNGGQPSGAWDYFVNHGIVSGGDNPEIGTGDTCYPYELEMCAHHVQSTLPPCSGEGSTPKCRSTCSEKGYPSLFKEDKHFAKSAYSISGETDIQREIMTNGPVTAAYSVYADFPNYKSGVYQHVKGSMLGGHAVKIIGWGVENDVPYWTVMNSWNEQWGDNGSFKILRGNDECGIESQISAGEVEYRK